MALTPNMFYEPLLTPGLLGALDPMDGLTGGGPAFVDFAPGAMPEQMSMLPSARTPADEFQMRIAQAEALAQAQNPQAPVAAQPAAPAPAAAPAGFQFMTDRGRQAGFGSNASGFITADPNAQYRCIRTLGGVTECTDAPRAARISAP